MTDSDNVLDALLSHNDGHYMVSQLLRSELDQVVRAFSSLEVHVHSADGRKSKSADRLLRSWKEELGLPEYYGENWDALSECLRDHEMLPHGPTLIIVDFAECLLESDSGRNKACLLRILNRMAMKRAESNYPIHDISLYYPPLWMLLNVTVGVTIPLWLRSLQWPLQ